MGLLGHTSRFSDSGGLGGGLRLSVSGKFPAMLILLVWGPCFENYSSDVPYSSACVPYTWPQGPLSAVYLSILVHMCLYSWYTGLLSGHGTDQACSHLRVVAWNVFPGCFKRLAPSASVQLLLSQPWLAMSCHHLHLSLSHHLLLCSLISLFSLPWRMQTFPFSVGDERCWKQQEDGTERKPNQELLLNDWRSWEKTLCLRGGDCSLFL